MRGNIPAISLSIALSIGLFGVLNAQSADGSENDFSKLSPEAATLLMMASYIGLGDFCWAYGVDYRELSKGLDNGFRSNLDANDPLVYLLWERGLAAGGLGKLFSPSTSSFVDVTRERDKRMLCDQAYLQVLQISKLK